MDRVKSEELLNEDGWKFVRKENEIQLWRKDKFYVWFDPNKGFSSIYEEPPEKPPD